MPILRNIAPKDSPLLQCAEFGVALVMILSAVPFIFLMFKDMATTSLWNDEIYSIMKFSSQGPWVVLTDYHVPNNHILFNFLNSWIEGVDRYYPFQARLWSFFAVLLGMVITLAFFGSVKHYFEGAIAFCLLWGTFEHLELILQARGYGLFSLFGLTLSVFIVKYHEQPTVFNSAILVIAATLGALTAPSFAFFATPLLLLLFLFNRDRRTFMIGLMFTLLVLSFWGFNFSELLQVTTTYNSMWGRQHFGGITGVASFLWTYIVDLPDVVYVAFMKGRFVVLMMLVLAGVVPMGLNYVSKIKNRESINIRGSFSIIQELPQLKALSILVLSIFSVFAICLYLKTPPFRTVIFLIGPVVIVTVLLGSFAYRNQKLRVLRPLVLFITLLFFIGYNIQKTSNYHFVPIENWMAVGTFIEKEFVPGTKITIDFQNTHNRNIRPYLSTKFAYAPFNLSEFLAGQLIVLGNDDFVNTVLQNLREQPNIQRFQSKRNTPLLAFYRRENGSVPLLSKNGFMEEDLQKLRSGKLKHSRLVRANLAESKLVGEDMTGFNLEGVILSWADLRQTNFKGAILKESVVISADLRNSDLSDADFRGSDLRQADLRWSNLKNTDFTDANLQGTILREAEYNTQTKWPKDFDPDIFGAVFVP
jgi:uncharacterized protein YjbI with pentapeptide repeats